MEWSSDRVMEFLDYYENEPVIWNPSIPDHRNRHIVHDAWRRIRTNMGEHYSILDLKKKKDSLMASFRSCCQKVKTSMRGGAGPEEAYKPQWFAFAKMASFLHDRSKGTINTEDNLSEDELATYETEENEQDVIDNKDIVLLPTFQPPSSKKRKLYKNDELKDKLDTAYVLPPDVNNPAGGRKVCTVFGELVAEKLLTMDEKNREICMHKIHKVMFEMKMKVNSHSTYNNQQASPTSSVTSD